MPVETLASPEVFSRKIQYVAFDFDGTLVDTMGEAPEIFAQHLESDFGIPFPVSRPHFINTLGTPTHIQIDDLLRTFNVFVPKEDLMTIARTIDSRLAKIPAKLFPEVVGVLEELTYEGYDMFITTSHTPNAISERLEEFNISNFFSLVIGKLPEYSAFIKGKPHFKQAAKHFGVHYEANFVPRLAMISDSESDIRLGSEAGAITFGRAGTVSDKKLLEAGAVAVLSDLSGLPEILRNL